MGTDHHFRREKLCKYKGCLMEMVVCPQFSNFKVVLDGA